MKETKITKRIFAAFVAFIVILLISCGDFQVFADDYTFYISTSNYAYNTHPSIIHLAVYSSDSSGNLTFLSSYTKNQSQNFTVSLPAGLYAFRFYYSDSGYTYYGALFVNGTRITLGGSTSNFSNYPTLSASDTLSCEMWWKHTSSDNYDQLRYYFYLPQVSTPTPEPTPTPTPTPVPTPTPEPTFNPDQPTYTTFFNHLLNDGNNALNALYLSWTQANNKFYTGIFFIGLPIMIGIFGIVASIFFGGDD